MHINGFILRSIAVYLMYVIFSKNELFTDFGPSEAWEAWYYGEVLNFLGLIYAFYQYRDGSNYSL
jgi:hypothetical protein